MLLSAVVTACSNDSPLSEPIVPDTRSAAAADSAAAGGLTLTLSFDTVWTDTLRVDFDDHAVR